MALALLAMALMSGSAQNVAPQAAFEKPRLICRENQELTGSHIRKGRRCKTAEHWLQEDGELDRIPPTMRITKGQGDAVTRERPP